MTFVILFAIGMLAFPIFLDIRRHGRDNILRRSGKDILEFRMVASVLAVLGDLKRKISDLVAAIVGFVLLIALGYVALKILGYLGRLVFGS